MCNTCNANILTSALQKIRTTKNYLKAKILSSPHFRELWLNIIGGSVATIAIYYTTGTGEWTLTRIRINIHFPCGSACICQYVQVKEGESLSKLKRLNTNVVLRVDRRANQARLYEPNPTPYCSYLDYMESFETINSNIV
uniref:Uncharacterized protein n=1 Tax=Glossina pallidipes TaxID=7398 RepID=A0A1A9ZBZ5_GLOPL